MKTMKQTFVLMLAVGMLPSALPAQSIWQKMKQAAKQSEQNAEAQSRQQQSRANASAGGSAQPASSAGSASSGFSQTPSPPADLSLPAMKALYRKLEIGGVYLGMSPAAAKAAITQREHDPQLEQNNFRFRDLPDTTLSDKISTTNYGANQTYEVGLTMAPMQPAVMSIHRTINFNDKNAPTVANTVEALRAKYGKESLQEGPDATSETTYYWIFDGAGRQIFDGPERRLSGPYRYENVIAACAQEGLYTPLDAVTNGYGHGTYLDCAPFTTLTVKVREWSSRYTNSAGQQMPRGLLQQLESSNVSYPMLMTSAEATRKMIVDARENRQQQEKKAADKNVAPL